jgi:hypothetical protein
MRHQAIAIVCCVSLLSGGSLAQAALLRTAQIDQAPASLQDANPSKAEPMMLGPTPDEDAASYRRDFVACESEIGERREACRQAVDHQYRPEVTNLSGSCDSLDAAAKAECLERNGPEK